MSTFDARIYSYNRTKSPRIVTVFHGTTKGAAKKIINGGFRDAYSLESEDANFFSYNPGYSCEYGTTVFVCYLCLKNPMPEEIFNSFNSSDYEENTKQRNLLAIREKYDGYYDDPTRPGSFALVWDYRSVIIVGLFNPYTPCNLTNRTLQQMRDEQNMKLTREKIVSDSSDDSSEDETPRMKRKQSSRSRK